MSLELTILKFLNSIISQGWEIVKLWWWLPLTFILWRQFTFFWRWWRIDGFLARQKKILLEIKMPKEVLKPIRAMEVVMASLHKVIYKPPDWWEKWIEGEVQLSYGFEIASIGGETHFFIRISAGYRDAVESAVYSQYPEAEISIADDYTKTVPQDIPNREWNLWASDYELIKKEDAYPIKTYLDFETEREAIEEKRIDPIAILLEAMAKIKPGEQLWVQILAGPVTNQESPWITKGQELRDKLAKREVKPSKKPLIIEAADVLITGEVPGTSKEEKDFLPPEMKLTPGEKEIIGKVEKKISKPGFKTNVRFIYLGKKDVFFSGNLRLAFSFLHSFVTEDVNGLKPHSATLTKIHKSWFLPLNLIHDRRLYLRKRKIFRKYCGRDHPYFPRLGEFPTTFILNTEEIATLFHFPSKRVASAPFVPRVEAKKGEAPPGLPTE